MADTNYSLLLLLISLQFGFPSRIAKAEDLQTVVPALLAARCVQCHGPGEAEAGLRLDNRKHATLELESGNTAIVAHHPQNSEILNRAVDHDNPMPPEGEQLTAQEIDQIKQWIAAGAPWQPHWAYRELQQSEVPDIAAQEYQSWSKTPIDAFIWQKLSEHGLKPSPLADRRTLIRRVYYDLIGMPPTPEEVADFLNDESADAYQRVVDRLLASPRYGEHWARHWMDVVHYADTLGFEHDIYRDSWPYRDYIIKSLNDDKPYGRFVKEQVAGDVLYPDDPEALVATGFLATGPWDLSALQSGNSDSIDYLISQYLDRDDIVSTVMSTFVSSTVECARCHDHKFDPITQSDYYNLQAVFSGIDKAVRFYDPDPQVAQHRKNLLQRKADIESRQASQDESLLEKPLQDEAAHWVSSLPSWQVLEPIEYHSAEEAVLEKQPDGSLYASGNRPATDTYTIQVHSKLNRLSAVQLKLIADDRLPSGGPGRQDNGNLHLNEFVLKIAPLDNLEDKQQISFKTSQADFNQQGWEVEKSIDANPATAWGIHPEVGKSHSAIYVFNEPQESNAGFELTFTLEQSHGRQHTIGRFRLSAIENVEPNSHLIDNDIRTAASVPINERTLDQKINLATAYLSWPIEQELASLPEQQKVYCGTNKFVGDRGLQPAATPRPIHILARGSIHSPGPLAHPGTLSCVPELESNFAIENSSDEGERRVALALWLASEKNVLTWRSIVNRVWHYHFGRGLVATPSDFGQMGATPSHPMLLDWLALNLQKNDGSLKWLHRLIVTSGVYRQASNHNADYAKLDAENRYLWRMNRQMLTAESIRDSLLQFSEKLDSQMGGPPVKQFVETRVFGIRKEADYAAFDVDDPGYFRRSVYRYVFRTIPDPFMNAMDCPDASQRAPVRNQSVTALQAAAMLNDPFLVRQCEHIATRLLQETSELNYQVGLAFEMIYSRPPLADEHSAVVEYAKNHGLANACRVLLNSNEFLFVD